MCIFHFDTTYPHEHPGKHGEFQGALRDLNVPRRRAARFQNVQAENALVKRPFKNRCILNVSLHQFEGHRAVAIICGKSGCVHSFFSGVFVPLMLKSSHGLTVFHIFRAIGVKKNVNIHFCIFMCQPHHKKITLLMLKMTKSMTPFSKICARPLRKKHTAAASHLEVAPAERLRWPRDCAGREVAKNSSKIHTRRPLQPPQTVLDR